jgi:hypothetical protein
MNEGLIVVDTAIGVLQAEALRGLLEAQGVEVTFSYESAGRVEGLSVGPVGEVDLLVPASQAARARRILADYYADRLISQE